MLSRGTGFKPSDQISVTECSVEPSSQIVKVTIVPGPLGLQGRISPVKSLKMESIHGHSAACCNIPPVISEGYMEKGKYETIGGLKTYVTGPSTAKTALLVIYDIFGFFPQTLQGADILATSDPEHQYQVFMPDFFQGQPCDIAWYPPVTDEQKKGMYDWFPTRLPQGPVGAPRIPTIIAGLEAIYGKKTWGAVGFCWGAKVVSLTSGPGTLFKACAQAHPGMMDVGDAEKIVVPTLLLASEEEGEQEVEKWGSALKVEKRVERWRDLVHGFMSARGDLGDDRCRGAYEKGYQAFLEWFAKYLYEV